MKMVHYKPVKVTIDAPGIGKVIINMVVHYHKVLELIVMDQGSLFTSKCGSLLCYFLEIKKKLFTAFHFQTDGQTKRQNSTIEVYFRAFVNWEQDASTGHTLFELNCGYNPRVSFEENVDSRSKSRSANKLVTELRELIEVCCQNLFHA